MFNIGRRKVEPGDMLLLELERRRQTRREQWRGACWLWSKAVVIPPRDAARATVRGKPKRLGTVRQDEGRIVHHIIPLIGSTPAKDIDRATVQRMVDAIAAGKMAVFIRKTKPQPRRHLRRRRGCGTRR